MPDVTKANASETAFDGVLDVTSPIIFVGGTEGVDCCGTRVIQSPSGFLNHTTPVSCVKVPSPLFFKVPSGMED